MDQVQYQYDNNAGNSVGVSMFFAIFITYGVATWTMHNKPERTQEFFHKQKKFILYSFLSIFCINYVSAYSAFFSWCTLVGYIIKLLSILGDNHPVREKWDHIGNIIFMTFLTAWYIGVVTDIVSNWAN